MKTNSLFIRSKWVLTNMAKSFLISLAFLVLDLHHPPKLLGMCFGYEVKEAAILAGNSEPDSLNTVSDFDTSSLKPDGDPVDKSASEEEDLESESMKDFVSTNSFSVTSAPAGIAVVCHR